MSRITTIIALFCALIGPTPVGGDETADADRFRVRSFTYPYDEGAVFAMPGEKIPLAVTAPAARPYQIEAPDGTLIAAGPNRWTWEAPLKPGVYEIDVKNAAGKTTAEFSAFVMVPATRATKGVLNNYRIGFYPDTPLKGNPIYIPPAGFIEVTRDNEDTKLSRHFRIKQFVTKQVSGYPKYVVLDERLIVLLETIGRTLEPLGWDAGDIFVMSGYRTPFYNRQLDDTTYSLHQWGRAADIFLDKDGNGMMDDFDRNRVASKEDAVALAHILESLSKTADVQSFFGGLGIYGSTEAHGPFVHVDTRPWRARW